jgi:hypothetical protein
VLAPILFGRWSPYWFPSIEDRTWPIPGAVFCWILFVQCLFPKCLSSVSWPINGLDMKLDVGEIWGCGNELFKNN